MASCRLCGYRLSRNRYSESHCPVCGEPHQSLRGHNGAFAAQADVGGNGRSTIQQPFRDQALSRLADNEDTPSPGLNLHLQSLLRLIPDDKEKGRRIQGTIRAAGTLHSNRMDGGYGETDVVYIRPRVDPTMRALKGRYNTQPRVAKAASKSVLHRLADPLIGYDSMEALAPSARRRREESIERLLETTVAARKPTVKGRAGQLLHKARSSTELYRASLSNVHLRQYSSSGDITSAESHRTARRASADSLDLWRRSPSTREIGNGCTSNQRKRQRPSPQHVLLRHSYASRRSSSTSDLRASGRVRGHRNIRRKRVATMRSVNGWVREADPTSVRRQASLEREMNPITSERGTRHWSGKEVNYRCSVSGRNSHNCAGRSSTFLTALDADADKLLVPSAECEPQDIRKGRRAPERLGDRNLSPDKPPKSGRRMSSVEKARGRQPRRGPAVGRRGSCIDARRKGEHRPSKARATSKGSVRVRQAWGPRRTSRSTLHAPNARQVPRSGGVGKPRGKPLFGWMGTARSSKHGRGPSEGCPVMPLTQMIVQTADSHLCGVDPDVMGDEAAAGGSCGRDCAGEGVELMPVQWEPEDGVEAVLLKENGLPRAPEVEGKDGGGHAAGNDSTSADVAPRFKSATPSNSRKDVNLHEDTWREVQTTPTSRPRSPWQLLRDGGEGLCPSVQPFSTGEGIRVSISPTSNIAVAISGVESRPGSRGAASLHHLTNIVHPINQGRDHQEHSLEDSFSGISSQLSMATMPHRPCSRGWTHRRSLPSLLHEKPKSSPRGSTPTTPTTNGMEEMREASLGRRSRRRRAPERHEPTGRMLRLDTNPVVTVGDAWAGHRSGRDVDESNRKGCTGIDQAENREDCAVAASDATYVDEGGVMALNETAVRDMVNRAGGGTSGRRISSRELTLSSGVLKPLLCVGSGRGYRMRPRRVHPRF